MGNAPSSWEVLKQKIAEELLSRKFWAMVTAVLTPLGAALQGALPWEVAVPAMVVALVGYIVARAVVDGKREEGAARVEAEIVRANGQKGSARLGMLVLLTLAGFALLLGGCNRYVVRDAAVYKAELGWTTSAFQQSGALHLVQAERLARLGDRPGCETAAELGLLLTIRGAWHSAMALYLLDEGEDPGPVPEVPLAGVWCAQRLPALRPAPTAMEGRL